MEEESEIRKVLARQVLTSDLVETLGETPAALKTVLMSKDPAIRRRCGQLAQDWRNRRDLAFSYRDAAAAVEKALHLDSIDFVDTALEKAATFSGLERRLLRRIADRLAKGDVSALSVAESRKAGFWAEQEPDLQAEWLLIWQAATLVSRAEEIAGSLKQPYKVQEIIAAYTREENSWSELDTLHRRLEKRASSLEFALSDPPAEIEQLVNHARHRYEWAAGQLAEKFLRSWKNAGFTSDGIYRQTQVYETFVEPLLREHHTAYFLVDARLPPSGQRLPPDSRISSRA